MGLTHVHGCVHTEVRVHHHDHGWVPTPNVHMVRNVIKAVRDALAHAVWQRGHEVSAKGYLVTVVELFVAVVKQVDLWIIEEWEAVFVVGPVTVSQET